MRVTRRFTRYEVAGDSMIPAFLPGDCLIVDRRARAIVPGDVVLARDPREPGRMLVKRVAMVEPGGRLVLHGDNATASTDSREFGAVPRELLGGRVVACYWPRSRAGFIRRATP